jgi:hypothetical protein
MVRDLVHKEIMIMRNWFILIGLIGCMETYAQSALDACGGFNKNDRFSFAFSVGETGNFTIGSVSDRYHATSGVLQPDNDVVISVYDTETSQICIFPNPVMDEFFIKGETGNIQFYKIRQADSRVIRTGIWDGKPVVTDGLPTGVYLLELFDKVKKQYIILKFIVI